MKKYISIILASLAMVSCVDTVLLPDDKTVDEDFWKTKDEVAQMVNGAYHSMLSADVINRLIVWGDFRSDELKMVSIDAPIGRNPYDRKKMAVVERGKKAITHFKVLKQFKGYSLIECQLETGRTHQIRVHLDYIGHAVAGDPLYGPRKTLKGNGQFLHAKVLGFKHPRTGKWMEFSVEPPQIFQETLAQLEKNK